MLSEEETGAFGAFIDGEYTMAVPTVALLYQLRYT